MAALLFKCPKTDQQAPAGIGTDTQSLRQLWQKTLKVNCPHCGETHKISIRNTYVRWARLKPRRVCNLHRILLPFAPIPAGPSRA